MFLLYYFI